MHPIRAYLERAIRDRVSRGETEDQDNPAYSPALFVQRRLLEFPFEAYPDYCYPGRLLQHEHMRWEHVEQTIRFCDRLPQPKGSRAGQPVRLLGFQVLIITCILGPEDPDTRLRTARTVVMTIARKNGKTSLVGMMLLAMMSLQCFDMRAQDIQVGASDREQAGKTFDILQNLVLLDKDMGLSDFYHPVPSKKKITHKRTYSTMECLSSDAYRAHGANPAVVLLDELGNLPDGKAREFYGVLSTAFGSQLEPLLLMFSTESPTDSHLFSEFVDRAKAVNAGADDDEGLIGFIFDLPKEDDGTGLICIEEEEEGSRKSASAKVVDHFAEANWTRPNPALEGLVEGGFRSLVDLRIKAREAQKMPSLENNFRNLQLNQRITSHSPFISQQAWMQCLVDPIDEDLLESCELFAGGDLSLSTDLSALAFCWRLDDGHFYARFLIYTPADTIEERSKNDRVPYSTWAAQGHMIAIPGRTIDFSRIAADLVSYAERYLLEGVGFDRYRWDQVRKETAALGYEPYESEPGDFWRGLGQGYLGANPAVEALENLVVNRRILIERNPVATWAASNCVTVMDDAHNRKFAKTRSYGRIDPIVALSMAVLLATEGDLNERAGEGESAYENADLLVL